MVEHLSSQSGNAGSASTSTGSSPVKSAASKAKVPTLSDIVARIKPSSVAAGDLHPEEKENQREASTSNDGRPHRLGTTGRLQTYSAVSNEGEGETTSPAGSTGSIMSASRGRGSTDRGKTLASLREKAASRSRSTSPTKPSFVSTGSSSQSPLTTASSIATTHSQASSSSSVGHKGIPTLQDIRDHMSSKKSSASTASISATLTSADGKTREDNDPFPLPAKSPSESPTEEQRKQPSPKVDDSPKKATEAGKSDAKLDPAANVKVLEPVKKEGHPLQHKWTLYFDSKSWNPSSTATSWEATLKMMGTYETVESFMSIFPTLRRPSQMERNCNYHLFKDGIKPMWEDKANARGGKWVLTLRNGNQALLDRSWMYLVLGLIGEELDEADDITGAVISTRPKGDRIAVWLRDKHDVAKVNGIGKRFVQLLDVDREPGVSLEFVANDKGASSKRSRAPLALPSSPTAASTVTPPMSWDENETSSSKLSSPSKFISFANPMPHIPHPPPPATGASASRPPSSDSSFGGSPKLFGSPPKPFGRRPFQDQQRHTASPAGQQQGSGAGGGVGLSLGGPIGRTTSPAPPSFRRQPLKG